MKKTNYILIALVIILLGYITFADNQPVEIPNNAEQKQLDSLQIAYGNLYLQTTQLEDSIKVLTAALEITQAAEITIYENFYDTINSIVDLNTDQHIKLFATFVSKENSNRK